MWWIVLWKHIIKYLLIFSRNLTYIMVDDQCLFHSRYSVTFDLIRSLSFGSLRKKNQSYPLLNLENAPTVEAYNSCTHILEANLQTLVFCVPLKCCAWNKRWKILTCIFSPGGKFAIEVPGDRSELYYFGGDAFDVHYSGWLKPPSSDRQIA